MKGLYLFLLRKLEAEVNDHRKAELKKQTNMFPHFGEVMHGHAWGVVFGIILMRLYLLSLEP